MRNILFLIVGLFLLTVPSLSKAETNTIFLTDIEDGRVFQRHLGVAEVNIAGTYTGNPTSIEYRIVFDGTNIPIYGHDWQPLDYFPGEGTFNGRAFGVPEGGWYNVDVRFSNDTAITDEGGNKWGVGILIGIIGQSNAKYWFDYGNDEIADGLLRKFHSGSWSTMGPFGSGATAFGNHLITNLGSAIPIGLLDYAVGGSALQEEAEAYYGYWENFDSVPYANFISAVNDVGGSLEYILWAQGETDAWVYAVPEYETSLKNFIEKVREDIVNSSAEPQLPFLVSLLGRYTGRGGYDNGFQVIRNAQENVVTSGSDIYLGSTTIDLDLRDYVHYSDAAYSTHGKRCAQTILHILGKEIYHRGPYIGSAVVIDATHTDIQIIHQGGSDFTPTTGITGFEITGKGEWETPSAAVRIDPTTIRLTHSQLSNLRTIRYLYGANPAVAEAVVDNTAMNLPLEGVDSLDVTQPQQDLCRIDPDPLILTYFQAEDATIPSESNFSEVKGEMLGEISQTALPPVGPPQSYNLHFMEAGIYYVWLLARSPTGRGEDNSAWYGLNGSVIGDISVKEISPGTFTRNKHWMHQSRYFGPGVAKIDIPSAGTYFFNLWSRDPEFAIDAIGITKSSDPEFDIQPPYRKVFPNFCGSSDLDGDWDGMADIWEYYHSLDRYDSEDAYYDSDFDGLTNLEEYELETDPQNPDTDYDSFKDGFDGFPVDPLQSTCLYPIRNYFTNEIFSSVQVAVDDANAVDDDLIQLTPTYFLEDIVYDRDIAMTLSGGYYCNFSDNPSTTSINSLTIRNGTVIVENILIKKLIADTYGLLPDTGQTISYTDTLGEDSDYSIRPLSYTLGIQGVTTDNETYLMWQTADNGATYSWMEALEVCENLSLAGFTDWRLPQKKELISIVDYGQNNPSIDQTSFLSTKSASYWTATSFENTPTYAWSVNFISGAVVGNRKDTSKYVRCVRAAPQATPSFLDNGDGTITDRNTRLIWQKQGDNITRDWEAALTYCENLELPEGKTDWRLPNIKELESITNDNLSYPAIDQTYFHPTESVAYWTSTTSVVNPAYAWQVMFHDGHLGYTQKRSNSLLRCVRGGQ